MDSQPFPILNRDQSTDPASAIGGRRDDVIDTADSSSSVEAQVLGTAAAIEPKPGKPISSLMEYCGWTVDAEDTVEKVEEALATHGFSALPVMGSDGRIIGIIGPQELALFLFGKKSAKTVRAWEISRCTMFEVMPDDSIEDVAKLMAENRIDYIAVTEHGALQGIVSMRDLVQGILKESTGWKA